jgi:type II secretory pathway pseudopilin PulG
MKNNNNNGLTIIETLVAIGIISAVIGAAISLIINISNYGTSAEVRSTAVNFAQEAVDIVKNVRDNQYCQFFSATYPNNRYYNATCSGGICNISPVGGSATPVWLSKYNIVTNPRENAASGNLRRSIRIIAVPGSSKPLEERRLIVDVQWQTKGMPSADTYKIVTDFYKWKY